MSKFEPEQFINYERIEQNVEAVKKRLDLYGFMFAQIVLLNATHTALLLGLIVGFSF